MEKFNQNPEQKITPENNPEEIHIQEAMGFIRMIIQECASLGANDSEMPDLEKLAQDVENKKIDPAEAKQIAQRIRDSKMDYH